MQNFSCWSQFICLAFTQLTGPESLRDIEACLGAQKRGSRITQDSLVDVSLRITRTSLYAASRSASKFGTQQLLHQRVLSAGALPSFP
jgi:hypothetical protein